MWTRMLSGDPWVINACFALYDPLALTANSQPLSYINTSITSARKMKARYILE
jgi:hypothetical protein